MFNFFEDDPLNPLRPRAGQHDMIAGPGPQRTPAELPAIDVPEVGSQHSALSNQPEESGVPRATMASPSLDSSPQPRAAALHDSLHDSSRSVDSSRSADIAGPSMSGSMTAPARNSAAIAGPSVDPLEQDRTQHQTELSRLRSTGSGISQIHNPFLRGLARVGDIAGSALFPFQTAMIPGTELHHRSLMRDETGAINQDLGEEHNQAQTAEIAAKGHQEEAETQSLQGGGKAEPIFDKAGDLIGFKGPGGLLGIDSPHLTPEMKSIVDQVKTKPPGTEFALWHQQNPNAPVSEFFKQKNAVKPDTSTQEDQRYERITSDLKLKKPVTPEDQAWAAAYEKRKTLAPVTSFNLNAPEKQAAGAEKSYTTQSKRLDTMGKPISDAVARLGRLQDTLRQNSPQADALVAPELLTVMAGGAGSGLRMNEAEIQRVVGGRSKWESLKASMNQWSLDPSKANSITPEQRQQIRALTSEVQRKLLAKQAILTKADEDLVETDDPAEHRRIVVRAKRALSDIDEGREPGAGGGSGSGLTADDLLKKYPPKNPSK
jgi:hypothetical protein